MSEEIMTYNMMALADGADKQIAQLTAERDALKAELQQIHDYHKAVMSEPCDANEKHRTCVPALRAEWERAVSLYEREAMQNVKYREALEKIASDDIEVGYDYYGRRKCEGCTGRQAIAKGALANGKE